MKGKVAGWYQAAAAAAAIPLTKQRIPDPSGGAAPYGRPGLEEPSPPLLSTAAESCRKDGL